MTVSVTQAVVLVGGRGTRLAPLTDTTPKALLPLAGRAFLDYQIDQIGAAGITTAYLAVGRAQHEEWQDYVAGHEGPVELRLAVEQDPLDTAGAVRAILDDLDERFLVLNGDVIFETPLAGFLDQAPAGAGAVLALARVPDPSQYGVVVMTDDGRVESFIEKPSPGSSPVDTVNAGIYMMSRKAVAAYPPGRLSFERKVFPGLVSAGQLFGVVVDGAWLDIGTVEFYLDAHRSLLVGSTSLKKGESHQVGRGSQVEGTCDGEWTSLGSDVTVDDGALVYESVIFNRARVHEGAVVGRSIIGTGAEVLPGAEVIEGSIIGAGALIGPGCQIRGGMRVAPGTKLGPKAITFDPPS